MIKKKLIFLFFINILLNNYFGLIFLQKREEIRKTTVKLGRNYSITYLESSVHYTIYIKVLTYSPLFFFSLLKSLYCLRCIGHTQSILIIKTYKA